METKDLEKHLTDIKPADARPRPGRTLDDTELRRVKGSGTDPTDLAGGDTKSGWVVAPSSGEADGQACQDGGTIIHIPPP